MKFIYLCLEVLIRLSIPATQAQTYSERLTELANIKRRPKRISTCEFNTGHGLSCAAYRDFLSNGVRLVFKCLDANYKSFPARP